MVFKHIQSGIKLINHNKSENYKNNNLFVNLTDIMIIMIVLRIYLNLGEKKMVKYFTHLDVSERMAILRLDYIN